MSSPVQPLGRSSSPDGAPSSAPAGDRDTLDMQITPQRANKQLTDAVSMESVDRLRDIVTKYKDVAGTGMPVIGKAATSVAGAAHSAIADSAITLARFVSVSIAFSLGTAVDWFEYCMADTTAGSPAPGPGRGLARAQSWPCR